MCHQFFNSLKGLEKLSITSVNRLFEILKTFLGGRNLGLAIWEARRRRGVWLHLPVSLDRGSAGSKKTYRGRKFICQKQRPVALFCPTGWTILTQSNKKWITNNLNSNFLCFNASYGSQFILRTRSALVIVRGKQEKSSFPDGSQQLRHSRPGVDYA